MPPNALPLTRLRICLDPAEYARKRRPHFIRYIDYDFRFQHRRVEAFAYVRDCVLEVAFRTDSAGETLPSQMPLVCFNPDDDGQDEDDSPFRRAYRQRCEGIAEIRDGLDARFPECEQEGVGYLDDDGRIFVVMRLLPDFSVVIVSGAPRPDILRWNYPAQPDPSDANSVQFADSADAAAYADRVFPGQRQVARCMAEEVLASSDLLRARVHHLQCAFPDVRVAHYSCDGDHIRIYIDIQWTIEALCYTDGTFRIRSSNPDPLLVRSGLRVLEADVKHAIDISTHFFRTGRVCANCSVTRHRKMRRCPCGGAYYCGRECQRAHWRRHKAGGCGARV